MLNVLNFLRSNIKNNFVKYTNFFQNLRKKINGLLLVNIYKDIALYNLMKFYQHLTF